MREIKFRIYSKKDKKFYYISQYVLSYSNNSEFLKVVKSQQLDDWQQFTGLKDKNGKEIWESDIVKHQYAGNQLVYWFHNGWSFKDNEKDVDYLPSYEDWGYVEVIGNIYENPELLNKE